MDFDKIISLSEKCVNFTNRFSGRLSYINEYNKLHSRKINFAVFIITILSISLFYFIISLNENNLLAKSIYIFTSLSLFMLSIPTLGTIILLFKSKESTNIKIYKYKTKGNNITYENSTSSLFKNKNSIQTISNHSKKAENKTGPKEFTPIIFTAIKYGLIHYFDKNRKQEDLSESNENFYKKIKTHEGYNIKQHYTTFWNESSNLESYFKQDKRIKYIDHMLADSEIKSYDKIIKFLNELKKRINSN